MLESKFYPRFKDTDALGHINNASYSTWFEEARRPIFKFFVPDLDPKKWSLIIARIEVDFLAQGHYQKETTVKTWVEKVGNSSFVLVQEAYQENVVVARGKSFLVHFDYSTNKSVKIPDEIRKNLEALIVKGN
ncbi:acyl-CoA thioesterase [Peredibacter starrii]|uniref:Thioesterase family protein n=1 Tax=Peredibacter starrii TaxID=28202 RepID=A0AAX4HTD9_9BACT|nr:thioesterase family protein [Peredibacter starrii]WPU66666.1 thioesterase family protein [Peredibacter starrii]